VKKIIFIATLTLQFSFAQESRLSPLSVFSRESIDPRNEQVKIEMIEDQIAQEQERLINYLKTISSGKRIPGEMLSFQRLVDSGVLSTEVLAKRLQAAGVQITKKNSELTLLSPGEIELVELLGDEFIKGSNDFLNEENSKRNAEIVELLEKEGSLEDNKRTELLDYYIRAKSVGSMDERRNKFISENLMPHLLAKANRPSLRLTDLRSFTEKGKKRRVFAELMKDPVVKKHIEDSLLVVTASKATHEKNRIPVNKRFRPPGASKLEQLDGNSYLQQTSYKLGDLVDNAGLRSGSDIAFNRFLLAKDYLGKMAANRLLASYSKIIEVSGSVGSKEIKEEIKALKALEKKRKPLTNKNKNAEKRLESLQKKFIKKYSENDSDVLSSLLEHYLKKSINKKSPESRFSSLTSLLGQFSEKIFGEVDARAPLIHRDTVYTDVLDTLNYWKNKNVKVGGLLNKKLSPEELKEYRQLTNVFQGDLKDLKILKALDSNNIQARRDMDSLLKAHLDVKQSSFELANLESEISGRNDVKNSLEQRQEQYFVDPGIEFNNIEAVNSLVEQRGKSAEKNCSFFFSRMSRIGLVD